VFPNGKEAIRVLTAEIEAQEKKQSETPKEAKATPDLVPLPTPVEQELARRVEEIRSKPIPISASIRSDMVRLIEILEKNGKNPELLQKAKEDLVFLDTVVSKHVVEWRVC
jgi:singapore isolate B (sub-type 7) whole genome shotgun sequence assembly, scaffold_8